MLPSLPIYEKRVLCALVGGLIGERPLSFYLIKNTGKWLEASFL